MPAKPYSLAVKAVALDAQNRCLLIRRSASNRHFVGCWEWPGGKVDPAEDFATAVARETREETSLEMEITGLVGATTFEMPTVRVILLCLEVRIVGGEIKLSDEHDTFDWVPFTEFSSRPFPEPVRDFMLEYAQRKGA